MIAVLQRRGRMPGECLPSGPKRELIFRHPAMGAALHAWAAVQPGPGEESVKNTALIASAAVAAATESAAGKNPTPGFAIVDCSYASGCLTGAKESNIDQLTFNTVQDGFLGGYLAAGMSKTGKGATFGGQDFGTVTIYMDGYWD